MRSGTGAGSRRMWRSSWHCFFYLLIACTATMPGCGGCGEETPEAKKAAEDKAKKEKPKPDFTKFRLRVLPNDGRPLSRAVKPGHWAAGTLRAKANNFTFVGQLDASVVDLGGLPLEVERTPFYLSSSPPARLTKGDIRYMELFFYVPRGREKSRLDCRLRDKSSLAEVKQESEFLVHMPAYQYYMFVMATQPDRYRNLAAYTVVRPPTDSLTNANDDLHYRVLRPRIKTQQIPLPSQPLAWTGIAYLFWDGVGPEELRRDQQQAMVDWLHWGGQLVISGPQTLDLLTGSFLAPYLPATTKKTAKISGENLKELSGYWTVATENGTARPLVALRPWAGIKLDKDPEAAYLAAATGLVAERSVGRGRIVVTAFRLSEPELLNWPSFDSFLNGAILRRDARTFRQTAGGGEETMWRGEPGQLADPRRNTMLRYFSRDARESGHVVTSHGRMTQLDGGVSDEGDRYVQAELKIVAGPGAGQSRTISHFGSEHRTRHEDWTELPDSNSVYVVDVGAESGVAGWNDFSAPAAAIRKALKDASGIVIPQRQFVLHVLLTYLFVIVPLNWFIFWLIGRVEWAWVAAPLIAIICAVTVVWLAQLDIGFARSKTEIATLELEGGFPRAHVTRCTTLYTSLSTRYNLQFEDPSAIAAPFSSGASFADVSRQHHSTVEYRRDADVRLADFDVPSNSTGMLRCEYMWDLGGSLALDESGSQVRVRNSTKLPLRSAAVVRRTGTTPLDGAAEVAWIGSLPAGASVPLRFERVTGRIAPSGWEDAPATAKQVVKGTLSVRRLMEMGISPAEMVEGDVRLVAFIDGELPGMQVQPVASQARYAGAVIAHLAHGPRPAARPDANLTSIPLDTIEPDDQSVLDEDDEDELSDEEKEADAEEEARSKR